MGNETDLPSDYKDMAERSRAANIADENAELIAGDSKASDDQAQNIGISSDEPAEGSEQAAPRQPGSPNG